MNQKQMLAMQQSTVSPCEALWCPGLTSLLASLDSIPSRLLSPSFCSPHDGHQCSLPCTPMWSVLHPSVLISQQHLTLRTIPSFSCPWLLGCWILLVFCLFFFFFLSPWVCFLRLSWWPLNFYPCWHTDFWPLHDGILREGPGCQVSFYLCIPSFSLNTAFLLMISSLFPQSWFIPRMPDLHMPPAAPRLECHTKVKSTGAKHNSGFSCPKPAYTLPAPRVISVRDTCLSSRSGQKPLSPRFPSLSLLPQASFQQVTLPLLHLLHPAPALLSNLPWSLAFCTWPLTSFLHFLSKSLLLRQSKWYWLNICWVSGIVLGAGM